MRPGLVRDRCRSRRKDAKLRQHVLLVEPRRGLDGLDEAALIAALSVELPL